jgi:phosphotriesterase-related protein
MTPETTRDAADAVARTVCGDVPLDDLGQTLMHEHVVLRTPGFSENYPWTYPRDAVIGDAARELSDLRSLGLSTVVDLTTVELGRDVLALAEVSRRSGVNIIAATGAYWYLPMYFQGRSAEKIADLFVRDVRDGVADSGIRAGVIKCAIEDSRMSRGIENLTRAAGLAQIETGAPISTHTAPKTGNGLLQAKVLAEVGVDPDRVVIGHSGDTTDLSYLLALVEQGFTVGLDRFGIDSVLPLTDRVATVAELCGRGHASRIVLSHDAFCFHDSMSKTWRDSHLPNWRMHFLYRGGLDMLRAAGVSDADLDLMMVENPRRLLRCPR